MKRLKTFIKISAIAATLMLILSTLSVAVFADYSTDGATKLYFTDNAVQVTAGEYDGYEVDGTNVKITKEGTYVLSGSCSDGSVTVKKGTQNVVIVLDGLSLTCADSAPIICNKSSSVTIVASSGSTNTLADTNKNNDEKFTDNANAENAVIKCKDGSKVTLCGTGTLNITANGKNGIKSGATTSEEGDAYLVIKELTLNITANVNDGINAEQDLTIESGNITVSAADDGIHSDLVLNIGKENSEGPNIKITKCYEGLEGAELNIYSGNIDINATDDCLNAANSDLSNYEFKLNIFGGTLNMYTTDGDGVDSNGSLSITGGTVIVWSAQTADNQPLDADGTVSITGGTVLAAGGSGGMGINLSTKQPYVIYGSSANAMGGKGMPGGNAPDSNFGGNGQADGNRFGGNPNNNEDSPMPKGDSSDNSGAGGPQKPDLVPEQENGKMQRPDNSSGTQMPQLPNNDGTDKPAGRDDNSMPQANGSGEAASELNITSGSTVSIKDSSGNTLISYTAPCNASYLIFSSADMKDGETYFVYVNDVAVSQATAATGTGNGSANSSDITLSLQKNSSSLIKIISITAVVLVFAALIVFVTIHLKKSKDK